MQVDSDSVNTSDRMKDNTVTVTVACEHVEVSIILFLYEVLVIIQNDYIPGSILCIACIYTHTHAWSDIGKQML